MFLNLSHKIFNEILANAKQLQANQINGRYFSG